MANHDIGTFGTPQSNIELRDHNGLIELVPGGGFDYAMLSYEDAARLAGALTVFLCQEAAIRLADADGK